MSLFVHALNTNYVSESGLGQLAGRAFSEGVMGTTDLAVSEKGTGTNMSVDVATGALILHNSSGHGHILYSSAVENVVIAAADALNPRKSLIVAVLDVDYTNAVDNDAEGGWSIIEVAGTAAAVPAEPDDTAIQTAAGAGNLYKVIALVDVGASATEIEDADITDRRDFASHQLPLDDGAVTTTKIADDAVTAEKRVFSGAVLGKSASQSVATSSNALVTFDTEAIDTDGYHNNVSNNSRLTVPATGRYRFSYSITFAVNANGTRGARLIVNSGDEYYSHDDHIGNSQAGVICHGESILSLNAGDYVEVLVRQTSGGNLNVLSNAVATGYTHFSVERLD